MNFTLHQLHVFSTVVEKKSITKAAAELNMTQPAVSIQLKNLQYQFDIPITELIKRKLYITDFGMELYQIAQNILSEVETITYKTLNYQGILSGKLRISVVSTGKYVLPFFLKDFLKIHPRIDLRMDVTNKSRVIESLENNEVDFSLVSVLPPDLALEEEILLPNKLFLIGPRDRSPRTKKALDKSVFTDIPLIYREEGSGTRHTMQQYFAKAHIHPKVNLELTSTEAVKQAVVAGLGFSILSLLSLKNELKQKEVEIIPVKGLPLVSNWRLIWLQKKKRSLVAQAYLDFIRKEKQTIHKKYFSWIDLY